jgi:archaemetzincin
VTLRILPVGPQPLDRLDALAAGLARVLGVSCSVEPVPFDPGFAWSPERAQYYSTRILAALPETTLGVSAHDLFVPILTFVFGEAQLRGSRALVSTYRLREEFYGDAADESKLRDRLLKEALHELGHNFGLRHCDDWRCVMASSHSVETLDLKVPAYCPQCRPALVPVRRA